MTIEQEFLLKLIKYSQFPEAVGSDAPGTDEGAPVPDAGPGHIEESIVPDGLDWEKLYREALTQSIPGVAGAGIDAAGLRDRMPVEVGKKWKDAEDRQLVNYIRYMRAQDELTSLMREKGITFIVLKGLAAAINYRDPSKRAMGDIDFIVPQDRFEDAKNLMIGEGYEPGNNSEDYTRHFAFNKDGVHFELHHHFSHEDRDVERFVTGGLENSRRVKIDSAEFSMTDKLGNGIILLDHMKQHLKSGLGLRQAIDWMMYVSRELDDSLWAEAFEAAAIEIRLDKFARVATRMCQLYLGLREDNISWCSSADPSLCLELLENLLVSGNFGRRNGDGGKVESVRAAMRREGVFRRLQSAGEANWQAYRRHKWLKPFAWIYQSGRYVKQGLRARKNGAVLKDDFKRADDRHKLLKDLEII